ncbi:MAG: carboxypeptidase regulatory-like domain-containing protein [Bacteroidota bacterium]
MVTTIAFSQKTVVEGLVTDTVSLPLPAATVVAMTPDSVMSAFGATDAAGQFTLRVKGPGKFLLQVTYVGYTTAWKEFILEPAQEKLVLDPLKLSVSNAVLPSVEISAERDPMRISRDTVDYNAAAFKVQPGAPVEDLLKKLPGVEVQRDGSVKAMGETVQNVLVDGKEFFGKDTRVATKNLPAEAVDRVQVFDKQSEMAELTGIRDGNEERTINLKLKETHKHGYFGKADAGAGTDYRYEGRMNLNRFSPDSRLSMIGMANNTNEVGF